MLPGLASSLVRGLVGASQSYQALVAAATRRRQRARPARAVVYRMLELAARRTRPGRIRLAWRTT
jgi:hypothetical protein